MMRLSPRMRLPSHREVARYIVQTRELDSRDCMRICQGKFCYGDKKNLERAVAARRAFLGILRPAWSPAAPAFYAYTT